MKESTVEAHLVKRVKALGGSCHKCRWIGRKYAPDRVVFLPKHRAGPTIWVELKRPGVAPDDGQLREHIRMRKLGQCVIVIDSIEAVDIFLSDL